MSRRKPRIRETRVAAPTVAVDLNSFKCAAPFLFFSLKRLTLTGKNTKIAGLILEFIVLENYFG